MDLKDKEDLLKSKQAAEVILELTRMDESYGSEIASALRKQQSSVSRTLRDLDSANFVKKTKRTKAQYYKIDFEGISNFVYEYLKDAESELKSDSMEGGVTSAVLEDYYKPILDYEYSLDKDKDEIKKFLENYYREGIQTATNESNVVGLESMLIRSLYVNIVHNECKRKKNHQKKYIRQILPLIEFKLFMLPLPVDIEDIIQGMD